MDGRPETAEWKLTNSANLPPLGPLSPVAGSSREVGPLGWVSSAAAYRRLLSIAPQKDPKTRARAPGHPVPTAHPRPPFSASRAANTRRDQALIQREDCLGAVSSDETRPRFTPLCLPLDISSRLDFAHVDAVLPPPRPSLKSTGQSCEYLPSQLLLGCRHGALSGASLPTGLSARRARDNPRLTASLQTRLCSRTDCSSRVQNHRLSGPFCVTKSPTNPWAAPIHIPPPLAADSTPRRRLSYPLFNTPQ
ncbi:hypothetical protein VTJ04DRAFT_3711 [Mycothermus thermophilus]|uniref:uncharacterized protein n=1 Tax=Humicola insolens TaxID=85995 RepID=UPI003742EE0E